MQKSWLGLTVFGALAAIMMTCHCRRIGHNILSGRVALEYEYGRSELLEEDRRFLMASIPLRNEIARALIRYELTLEEAAACFLRIEAQMPPGRKRSYVRHPGSSVEEQICRHVIQFVRVELRDDSRQEGIVSQLEAELQERLDAGTLRLPEAPPAWAFRLWLNTRNSNV